MCGRLWPGQARPGRSASSGIAVRAADQAHGGIVACGPNPHRGSAVSPLAAAAQGVTAIVSRLLFAVLPAPSRARAKTLTVVRPSAGTGTFHS